MRLTFTFVNRTRRGPTRICAGIWTALLASMLVFIPLSASAAPGADQGLGEEHRSERAAAALQAAREIFSGAGRSALGHGRARSDATSTQSNGRDATLVLRDLAANLDALDPVDQRVARRILARPTDDFSGDLEGVKYGDAPHRSTCDDPSQTQLEVCVHWVTDPTDPNAPSLADSDGDGVPDWVEQTQAVFHEVWQRVVVQLGYRPPRSDLGHADHGPDGRTDIYIADLPPHYYGYCASEPLLDSDVTSPAYCVLDDDYAPTEFGSRTPPENLRVTAAHEFFHAVQFAYNWQADTWLMEGTAAWMEDEVYDQINDNLQYLSRSALRYPFIPLDYVNSSNYNWAYGSWIWWRFLSEYFGSGSAQDPSVVKQIWQRVAGGQATLPALRGVIANRGSSFVDVFADFAAVNRSPKAWYDEGGFYSKYVAAPGGRFVLRKASPGTGWMFTKLPHLSSQHVMFRPGTSLLGRWRLRVDLNLPDRSRGSKATVMVHRTDGRTRWLRVALDRDGDTRFSVPFSRRGISNVVVTVTNASTRMSSCGSGTLWSCAGKPLDDGRDGTGLPFAFNARAVR